MYTPHEVAIKEQDHLTALGNGNCSAADIVSYINETNRTIYIGKRDGCILTLPPLEGSRQYNVNNGYLTISRKVGLNQPIGIETHTTSQVSEASAALMSEDDLRIARHFSDPKLSSPNVYHNRVTDALVPFSVKFSEGQVSLSIEDIERESGVIYLSSLDITVSVDRDLIYKNTHPYVSIGIDSVGLLQERAKFSQGAIFELVDPNFRFGAVWYREGEAARCISRNPRSIMPEGLYIHEKGLGENFTTIHIPLDEVLGNRIGNYIFYATADEVLKKSEDARALTQVEEIKRDTETRKAQARLEAAELERISAARKDASEGIKFWATLVTALVSIISGLIAIFRR